MNDITNGERVKVKSVEYVIIRQKRKTAAIKIEKDLKVVVKVPLYMRDNEVQDFILKYEKWVQESLDKKQKVKDNNDWILNKKIMYLGEYKEINIQVVPYAKEIVILNDKGFKMITSGNEELMRKAMETFLKTRSKKLFSSITETYAQLVDVKFNKITIRKQETRWGSCSQNGNLSYNVKLMCAPMEIIEYVILHEVMHLRHFNHSLAFWDDIKEIMPDYKERMAYLKQFGHSFII